MGWCRVGVTRHVNWQVLQGRALPAIMWRGCIDGRGYMERMQNALTMADFAGCSSALVTFGLIQGASI